MFRASELLFKGTCEHYCFVVFMVHCGTFYRANVLVHWEDFAIKKTALK